MCKFNAQVWVDVFIYAYHTFDIGWFDFWNNFALAIQRIKAASYERKSRTFPVIENTPWKYTCLDMNKYVPPYMIGQI